MEFSRQEFWSGLPFPSPGDLPNPAIETGSPTLQADSLPSEPPGKPPETPVVLLDTSHSGSSVSSLQETGFIQPPRPSLSSKQQILIKEGKGCRDKGGAANKQ